MPANAAEQPATELQIRCLKTAHSPGCSDPGAIAQLAWQLRRRTSIAVSLSSDSIDLEDPSLFAQGVLIWQGRHGFAPLSATARARLASWLQAGGMLLLDAADAAPSLGRTEFLRDARREIQAALAHAAVTQLLPLAQTHVFWRSFYLLQPPRLAAGSACAILLQGRPAVLQTQEPWLASIAQGADGTWLHPFAAAENPQLASAQTRELKLRLLINWLMYALCLDYKDDQVHLPYILQRRSQ